MKLVGILVTLLGVVAGASIAAFALPTMAHLMIECTPGDMVQDPCAGEAIYVRQMFWRGVAALATVVLGLVLMLTGHARQVEARLEEGRSARTGPHWDPP